MNLVKIKDKLIDLDYVIDLVHEEKSSTIKYTEDGKIYELTVTDQEDIKRLKDKYEEVNSQIVARFTSAFRK